MAQKGATLQTTNTDLVKHIENIRLRKSNIDRTIKQQEEEREKLIHSIQILQDKMGRIDESLSKKVS